MSVTWDQNAESDGELDSVMSQQSRSNAQSSCVIYLAILVFGGLLVSCVASILWVALATPDFDTMASVAAVDIEPEINFEIVEKAKLKDGSWDLKLRCQVANAEELKSLKLLNFKVSSPMGVKITEKQPLKTKDAEGATREMLINFSGLKSGTKIVNFVFDVDESRVAGGSSSGTIYEKQFTAKLVEYKETVAKPGQGLSKKRIDSDF